MGTALISIFYFAGAGFPVCLVQTGRLFIAPEDLTEGLLGSTSGTGEQNLGNVVREKTADVLLMALAKNFLRLYHFKCLVGATGRESILRLRHMSAAHSPG